MCACDFIAFWACNNHCVHHRLQRNEVTDTFSLSSSHTVSLIPPCSQHITLCESLPYCLNNHTLFRILAAIFRQADLLFESQHRGILVTLKIKFPLRSHSHTHGHSHTHILIFSHQRFTPFSFFSRHNMSVLVVSVIHLPRLPPSAMQRLFIGSNDQWEWVLGEPFLLDAWGTQQSSSRPSAVTLEWPEDMLELCVLDVGPLRAERSFRSYTSAKINKSNSPGQFGNYSGEWCVVHTLALQPILEIFAWIND